MKKAWFNVWYKPCVALDVPILIHGVLIKHLQCSKCRLRNDTSEGINKYKFFSLLDVSNIKKRQNRELHHGTHMEMAQQVKTLHSKYEDLSVIPVSV